MEEQHRHKTRARLVVPTRSDALLSRWTELVGGRLGFRTAPGVVTPGFFTVDRVLILLTVVAALIAMAATSYCRLNGWDAAAAYYATCSSGIPTALSGAAFAHGSLPLFTPGAPFGHPVLLSLVAALTSWAVPGAVPAQRALSYFDLNAVLIVALWMGTVILVARLARRRAWDAAMVALAPGIITSAFLGWDLWAVFAVTVAMLCFARHRPAWAGIWIGLGAGFALYPLLLPVALLLLAVRSGRFRELLFTLTATVVTLLAVNAPVAVVNPGAFRAVVGSVIPGGAGASSIWEAWNLIAARLGHPVLGTTQVTVGTLAAFLALLLVIAGVTLTAPRRPRLAQVLFLLVMAAVLCAPGYPPQAVLWLVPLVALARPVWRDFLLWQAAEILRWAAQSMHLAAVTGGAGPQHTIDDPYYACAILLHLGVGLYLMVRVVGDMLSPDGDIVRAGGADDPQGGVFDGGPDRAFVLRARRAPSSRTAGTARRSGHRHGPAARP
ncbi:hypothetical protein Q9R02_06785 [Arthrobacter sp. YJM1]|uniref:DUF2029 domain-containing protein n=1 Tax=Arthrobacter horti TaxID=3068273 RepID=A0ABT9IMM7_9MICC|nr:glycosyltransferase 87 family protein [Arthrobacter sp. YJM1]MDP5226854.1 hypothetical protein [Arthrobacter sp. YJM1]